MAKPSDSATYQFEWLPSFDSPLYVRLHRTPAETTATWVRWRADRTAPGDSAKRQLNAAEWNGFEVRLAAAQFWQLPADHPVCGTDTSCTDGAYWTVEGAEGGRDHRETRWSPGDTGVDASFRGLALYMVHVSGAPVDSSHVF